MSSGSGEIRPAAANLRRRRCNAIVSNPPYGTGGRRALEFIERSLELTRPVQGIVAMLLKVDFDSGKSRRHVFADCPAFAGKVVLIERIVWFEPAIAEPSDNHAWHVWPWSHCGPPTISYAPLKSERPKVVRVVRRKAVVAA